MVKTNYSTSALQYFQLVPFQESDLSVLEADNSFSGGSSLYNRLTSTLENVSRRFLLLVHMFSTLNTEKKQEEGHCGGAVLLYLFTYSTCLLWRQ
jgi:hypothetical protein